MTKLRFFTPDPSPVRQKRFRLWTPDMVARLRLLFPHHTRKAIGVMMGLKEQQIRSKGRQLGLKKEDPAAFNACYQKSIENRGRFKKGNEPQTTAVQGNRTCSIRMDKRGIPQRYIRVALGRWEYLSRFVWETFFGPIPAGHIIVFRDGDTLNCHLDNLLMITRQQNARRNINYAKGSQTLRERYAAGTIDNPFVRMHDVAVAGWLFPRDAVARQFVLDHQPALIRAKRAELQLRKTLKQLTHE